MIGSGTESSSSSSSEKCSSNSFSIYSCRIRSICSSSKSREGRIATSPVRTSSTGFSTCSSVSVYQQVRVYPFHPRVDCFGSRHWQPPAGQCPATPRPATPTGVAGSHPPASLPIRHQQSPHFCTICCFESTIREQLEPFLYGHENRNG